MSQMIRAEGLEPLPFVLRPPFPPPLETQFQRDYYLRVIHTLRYASLLLAALFLAYAVRDYLDTHSILHFLQQNGAPALFYAVLFGLTFWSGFSEVWQAVLVLGALATGFFSLDNMGTILGNSPPASMGPFAAQHLFFGVQTITLMVAAALLRVQFRFALVLQLGLLLISLFTFVVHLEPVSPDPADALARFLQPILVIGVMTLLGAYVQEQVSRQAFYAAYLLDQERSAEHRKRIETEGKLQVLGQAIGGIVHDLGNPLTSVQLGVSTLELFMEDPDTDPATLTEFTQSIHHGAEMLNFLRLSLMEQTRVLDGKPTPVELRRSSLRAIVQAGVHYQKPNHASGRTIAVPDVDVDVYADAMKLTTVFMNLIGNALKYSDGEVEVRWREEGPWILVAVLDRGMESRGISQTDARKLFVPFGRLDEHESVEGTGLGLLSVRSVAEAHGGEVYIEGHLDGTAQSEFYTTAERPYPRMLAPGQVSAFVVALRGFTVDPIAAHE